MRKSEHYRFLLQQTLKATAATPTPAKDFYPRNLTQQALPPTNVDAFTSKLIPKQNLGFLKATRFQIKVYVGVLNVEA